MHEFVKIALVIAIAGGAFIVSAKFHALGLERTLLAQITLDPPDRQPGTTSGTTQPTKKKPESQSATLPVPSIALDPPINQTDELELGSASPITSIERVERGTVPLAQPTGVEPGAPTSTTSPAVSSPQPPAPAPAPAAPAASILPPSLAKPAPAPVAEPGDQDKNDNRGRREDNDNKGKWTGGDKKGYGQGQDYRDGVDRDGPDASYRLERADKVDRTDKVDRPDKIDRPEKIERAEKVERVEKVDRVEKIEKIEKVEKSGRPERVERFQKIEKPERGKH